MEYKIDKKFFEQEFTHIGFIGNDNFIVWNEIINPMSRGTILFDHYNQDAKSISLQFVISDKRILQNKENKDTFFMLNKDKEIIYFNTLHWVEKKLLTNYGYGIRIQVLLSSLAYSNSYSLYNFIFKKKLAWISNKTTLMEWDFIKKIAMNDENLEDCIYLHFYGEELKRIFNLLESNNLEDYKDFTLKIEKGLDPVIEEIL